MNGRLVIVGIVAVVAVGAAVVVASGGSDEEAPAATVAAAPEAAREATTTAVVTETTVAVASEEASSPPTAEEGTADASEAAEPTLDCTSTMEPHLTFTGVVTDVDGTPIAIQGEYSGEWFTMGNAVQVVVPENGGAAIASIVGVLGSDAGAGLTFNVGHDSRAAYPPPDERAPENYLGYTAGSPDLSGSVGMSLTSYEAGELPTLESEYVQSTFEAIYDEAQGSLTGTVTHPETVVAFVADTFVRDDKPVWSTPECFAAAIGEVREADNP